MAPTANFVEVERALTAIPRSWASWIFELHEGDSTVATITTSWARERGTLTSGGKTWQLARESWMAGNFTLKQGDRTFATAEKPSAFFRAFQVTFDHEHFDWAAESAFTRAFVLRKGNSVVGSMRPTSAFTRRAIVDLPAELSLERKAFLVWLAILMWKRQAQSGTT